MNLKEHIALLLGQDYDETELCARLWALLTLWGGSAAMHPPSAHDLSGTAGAGPSSLEGTEPHEG